MSPAARGSAQDQGAQLRRGAVRMELRALSFAVAMRCANATANLTHWRIAPRCSLLREPALKNVSPLRVAPRKIRGRSSGGGAVAAGVPSGPVGLRGATGLVARRCPRGTPAPPLLYPDKTFVPTGDILSPPPVTFCHRSTIYIQIYADIAERRRRSANIAQNAHFVQIRAISILAGVCPRVRFWG